MGIGKQIRRAREQLGLTQGQLAKAVGVTKSAIGNYESGVSHPKEPVLYALLIPFGQYGVFDNVYWFDKRRGDLFPG